MKKALAFVVARLAQLRPLFVRLRALLSRARRDPDVLREIAPLVVTVVLAPWFYLALGNYRDAAVFRDVSMFNYAAFCIRKGERIYDTVATPDGPLIYWIEAIFQTFSGVSDKLQRRVDIDVQMFIGAALALLIVPRAPVWKWLRRFVWAVVGATLWLGWIIQSDFASTLQRETYYVAFGSLGIALVYASADRSPRVAGVMQTLGGFLAGLQMFGKHSGLLYAGIAVLTAMLLPRQRSPWRENVTWTFVGVLLATVVVFGFLLAFGSVRGFVFWYVHYDFEAYRFFHITNVPDMLGSGFIDHYSHAAAILAIGVIGIAARVLPARSIGFALAPMLSSFANILQLHGWAYQVSPVLASTYLFYLYVLGLAWAPSSHFGRLHKIAAIGVGAILLPLCVKQIMGTPWVQPKEKQLTAVDMINHRSAGDFLSIHTQSTDRVLYYGGDAIAPFVAQRRPATPYIVRWLVDLRGQIAEPTQVDLLHRPTPEQFAHITEMMGKLQADACKRVIDNPPAAMVFEGTPGYTADPLSDYIGFCPALDPLMKTQYYAAATFGDSRVFLRNDRQ